MKLASLKAGGRDGTLVVVDKRLQNAVKVPEIATSLVHALEDWAMAEHKLQSVSDSLNSGKAKDAFKLNAGDLAAALPRAPQFPAPAPPSPAARPRSPRVSSANSRK
ncbi:MAG: hypothetical protein ACHQAZ_01480 [Gammaproteobacteria bacterium]